VTLVAVTAATVAAARLLAPVVVAGPPAPGAVWAGWLCTVGPFAVAAGCAAAVQRHHLRSTWRERWLIVAGGWVCGALGCLVLISPLVDAAPLFPIAELGNSWQAADGALVDVAHGVRVDAEGGISIGPRHQTEEAGLRPSALQILVAVASLALWTPVLVAVPGHRAPKVAALVVTVVAFIVLVHAVGAGRVTPGWLALVAVPSLGTTVALVLANERKSRGHPSVREGS
jgi:hypothetical protein